MHEHVGDEVLVKAAGGIRDADTFLAMVRAGARRIGTSAGVAIIEQLRERMEAEGVTEIEL
jgi:deoxyribose-phosphate aldolase